MKKSKTLLPSGLLSFSALSMAIVLAGCSGPDDTTVVDRSPDKSDGIVTTPTEAPTPQATYRVVDANQPGYLPQMEKVRVPPPPADFKVPANAKVKFETSKGDFIIELNTKEAPLHTKSFYYLAKRGFYNGVTFHRYADLTSQGGFIIQGGDPFSKSADTKELAGQGGPGYEIPREHNALKHDKLVIAAARSSDPDSAGSQFYFTFTAVPFLDEGDGYTVFGKVTSGGENVLKLRQDDVIKKAIAQ
jgi:peptidyl-prolyl cis-trans isomerase B (cyclophilin B)